VIPATHRRDCAACGAGVAFDEDGLCSQCGADTVLVDVATGKPDPGPAPEPVKPPATCGNCEIGFPLNEDGMHYGTQRLGMIPLTPCSARTPAAGTAPKGER